MASNTYPKIPAKNWWLLRNRFKQSLPSSVSANYLATLLGITERGAKNVLPNLKAVGLLDEDGNTTERAKGWRDDQDYQQVCQAIIDEVYPSELVDLVSNPSEDFDDAVRWFMRDTGSGEGNAKQMATFYQLLSKADVTEGEDVTKTKSSSKRSKSTKVTQPKDNSANTSTTEEPNVEKPDPASEIPDRRPSQSPTLHIDVQIHISADASAEQIDQIFASMAKHLYSK